MMTQFVEVPSKTDFISLLIRDDEYIQQSNVNQEILLPTYEKIQTKKPLSQFILPDLYLRILPPYSTFPPQDYYELDSQDLSFLQMHNYITEDQLTKYIKILEKNNKCVRQWRKAANAVPYEILYYWNSKKQQLGRGLLRMNMNETIFQPRIEPKHKRVGFRIKCSKEQISNNQEILLLENQIGLRLLKLLKEREKRKKAILMVNAGLFPEQSEVEEVNDHQSEMKIFTQLHKLQSKFFGSFQCTQNCFYNQFQHLPITFLCTEVIEYMTCQQKLSKEQGRYIPWPEYPAIIRDLHEDMLIVKPCNRIGVIIEEQKIFIGEECKTLILKQMGNKHTEISLIDGNKIRTNLVEMQFNHMKEHGIQYKQNEQNYIKLIQQEVEKRINIYVELENEESEFYIQI